MSATAPSLSQPWLTFWFEPWINADSSWLEGSPFPPALWGALDTVAKRKAFPLWCRHFHLEGYWGPSDAPDYCELVAAPAAAQSQVASLIAALTSPSGASAAPNSTHLLWAKQYALASPMPQVDAAIPSELAGILMMRTLVSGNTRPLWSRLRMQLPYSLVCQAEQIAGDTVLPDDESIQRRMMRFWRAALRRIENNATPG